MTFHLHSSTRSTILHEKAYFADIVFNVGQKNNMLVLNIGVYICGGKGGLFGKNYLCALAWSGLSGLGR